MSLRYLEEDEKGSIEKRLQELIEYFNFAPGDVETNNMAWAATLIRTLKDELEMIDELKKTYQKLYDFISISLVPDKMSDEGVETLKVQNVGRLQCSADIRCSVPAQNRPQLMQWLDEHNHSAMISKTVNSSTLKAFIKEQMKENKEYPEDLLKIEPYSRATVVKV